MRLSVGREKRRKGGDRMNEITLTDLYGIVVGIQKDEVVDFDIQEALSMKKPYEDELHKIAEELAL